MGTSPRLAVSVSADQLMEQDDGRKGASTSDAETGNADIAEQQALAADDHSASENSPDTTDSFIQEGSKKKQSRQHPDDTSDDSENGDRGMPVVKKMLLIASVHQPMKREDEHVDADGTEVHRKANMLRDSTGPFHYAHVEFKDMHIVNHAVDCGGNVWTLPSPDCLGQHIKRESRFMLSKTDLFTRTEDGTVWTRTVRCSVMENLEATEVKCFYHEKFGADASLEGEAYDSQLESYEKSLQE